MKFYPFIASSLLVLVASCPRNATADSVNVICPTGVFPTDVQNVQAALDQGGTVLLKATDQNHHTLAFNFGPAASSAVPNYVSFTKDTSVRGEFAGVSRTTIKGGHQPFG
jgi:hypothetical protein